MPHRGAEPGSPGPPNAPTPGPVAWWLAAPLALAAVALAAAVLVNADRWAAIFHHPAREPLPETTRQGAHLWRAGLFISVAALAGLPLLLHALSRPRRFPGELRTAADLKPPSQIITRWLLVMLMAVAAAARLTRLGESLWYDEIAAWITFGVHGPGAIVGNYVDPANHIAHTLLTWCSTELLESSIGSEAALRLPALLFSVLSVPAFFALARRSGLGERASLLAAAIAAVMPVMVLEGVEARGYSMMICFSALMTTALLAAWTEARPWQWCLYAAACALGIWSHPMTAFVPAGHVLWFLWRGWSERGDAGLRRVCCAFIALAIAAMLTITLYAPVIPDMLQISTMFEANRPDQPRILGPEGLHALLQLGGSWYWWAALPGLLVTAVGAAALVRNRVRGQLALASWLGLPIAIACIAIAGTWIYARFLLFLVPAAAITIAAGLAALWTTRRPLGILAGCLLLVGWTMDLATRPPKQPLRDASTYVAAHHSPRGSAARVLVIGVAHRVNDVYSKDLELHYCYQWSDLASELDRARARWVILYYPNRITRSAYDLLGARGFVERQRFAGWVDWTNGDVLVYEKPGAGRSE